jgi:Tfp pilus assembly protein PilX
MLINKQKGAALFTALIFLLILTLIGVTALRNSGLSEKMSANSQIAQMAFQAAESAANRYQAEYNYNVSAPAPATSAAAKSVRLAEYLPLVNAGGAPYLEFCLNDGIATNSTSVRSNFPAFNTDVDCTSVYMDGTRAAVTAKNKVIYENCGNLLTTCPGFSSNGDISCHIFKMETEGTVAGANGTTVFTDQWASVVGACIN